MNHLSDTSIPLTLRTAMADAGLRFAEARITCAIGPYKHGDTNCSLGFILHDINDEIRIGAAIIASRAWE